MSATPYYRVGSYYVDDTDPANPVLYRCHTAGDKASSGWAKITGAKSNSGWNYRGLYDPASSSPYMTYDVVQYGAGTSAGMYVSMIDNNSNAPDSGIGWVQVSTGTGTWL